MRGRERPPRGRPWVEAIPAPSRRRPLNVPDYSQLSESQHLSLPLFCAGKAAAREKVTFYVKRMDKGADGSDDGRGSGQKQRSEEDTEGPHY